MNYLSIIAVCGVLFTWAQSSPSKTTPLIVGAWKLNTEKSNLPPFPPGYFEFRQYRIRDDGYLVGLLVTSNARGYHYLQFTAKSDGKDYPEYTDDLLADLIAADKQTTRTYAETIVDDYVTEWTDKVNGRVTGHGKKIVSKDRNTLTVTVEGTRPQTIVYDRVLTEAAPTGRR